MKDWSCFSASGITHVYRLAIGMKGTIPSDAHKDSLAIDAWTFGDAGNPVLFFSSGRDYGSQQFQTALRTRWMNVLAKYSSTTDRWELSDLQQFPDKTPANCQSPPDCPAPGWWGSGGISSPDGTLAFGGNIIANKYNGDTAGSWGPVTNHPGTGSTIPSVSDTQSVDVSGNPVDYYELVGSNGPNGATGLDAVRTLIGCHIMNPTLYNYDSDGHPHSFMAYLFDSKSGDPSAPCTIPSSPPSQLPQEYYPFNETSFGWEIDWAHPNWTVQRSDGQSFSVGDQGKGGAVNAMHHDSDPARFVYAEFGGGGARAQLRITDITNPERSGIPLTCDGDHVHFSEASCLDDGKIRCWFLADTGDIFHDVFLATP
jgi:hypothetical protein